MEDNAADRRGTEVARKLPFTGLDSAVEWLDSHIDFESKMPTRRALPTLDRMRALMTLLGDPEESIPSVHVTGTNGKGSTSAMVTALMMAQGLSVGTYTSPNLERVSERLAYNGQPIDDESFVGVLSELASLEPMLHERPTRFELLTAAAWSWFADDAVDAMVVEVGLGGTWDSTNVMHGDVAVLTNFSYDHTDVLGPTLEGIAEDKSGIIEEGSVVVVGETRPDLVAIVEAHAARVGAAAVWVAGRDFGCADNRVAVGGRLVTLWTPGWALRRCAGTPARGAPGRQCRLRVGGGGGILRSAPRPGRGRRGLRDRPGSRAPRSGGPPTPPGARRGPQRGRHDGPGARVGRGVRGGGEHRGGGGDAVGP